MRPRLPTVDESQCGLEILRLHENLSFAADAHYHHLTDDIIRGGKMKYVNGAIVVPRDPGLGVELDRDKLRQYSELYKELGSYSYDRDPHRPDWFAITPERRWAIPGKS